MSQRYIKKLQKLWDTEYKKRNLMTGSKPAKSVLNFVKFLKKDLGLRGKELPFKGFKVLDLGSGEGKNAALFASLGAEVYAIELSSVAHKSAVQLYGILKNIHFINDSFAKDLSFKDNFFDIALDVTSSNSLNESLREKYFSEACRVLKPGAFFFVRALLLDSDKNAKALLKKYPGAEEGTYILPELNIQEKVFRKKEFIEFYSRCFDVVHLEKETHYSKFNSRSFKRNFIVAYLKKR